MKHNTQIQAAQFDTEFDTDLAGAIDYLTSLFPSELSDSVLVGRLFFKDKEYKRSILKLFDDTDRGREAFYKVAEQEKADGVEFFGNIGQYRNMHNPMEAAHFLELWGYKVDTSEKT